MWVKGEPAAPLAIVLKPRGEDWLRDDLVRYRQCGVETMVSLLEADEAQWLGLADEGPVAREVGMEFVSFPIPDVHVPPNLASFRIFVTGLAQRLCAGERLGVHCRGSIGRSTVTAACTLMHLGWEARAALKAIEAARGCPVPDTAEQLRWILGYEAEP